MTKPEIEVVYNLGGYAIRKGASPRDVLAVLQDEWGAPPHRFIKADDETVDRTIPGAHGIPEIARAEKAYFNALTEGQKDAYRAVAELVEQAYKANMGWAGVDPWTINEPIDEWKRKAFVALATHPMQAFLVGQMLANEAMNSMTARPLYPNDKQAIEFLEHTGFNEIDASFENLKSLLRARLIEGMQEGENPKEIARRMARELKDYEHDFGLVTITETSRAANTGALREMQDADEEWAIGSSAHDPKTCDACKELIDGKKVRVSDVLNATNKGRKRADWIACIPLHPRCVAAGAEVMTPNGRVAIESIRPGDFVLTHRSRFRRVDAVSTREHAGSIFDVGGLRVTGNHPVLTPDGFREASSLGEFSDVLGVSRESWLEVRSDNAHNAPSESGQDGFLGFILRLLARGLVPAAAVNFNGQHGIGNRQVDIEFIDRELRNGRFANANIMAQLVDRLSREMLRVKRQDELLRGALAVPLVRSERVTRSDFTGHVYDLQVREDESFVAEGIAIHNCRCVWLPWTPETDEIINREGDAA